MKRILYILNIANRVNNFSYTSMKAAQELGFDFHIAGNWNYPTEQDLHDDEEKKCITIHQVDFHRNPFHPSNIKAYLQIKKIIEKERIDIIHCNTPIGGVVGRLAGKRCQVETIIYQAHGFHFWNGAPLINWLLYYPIERWLAHYTDALVTINQEDYKRAQDFNLRKRGRAYYVPGVGIDLELYEHRQKKRDSKRRELNLSENDIMIISPWDLMDRNNNETSIEAVAQAKNPRLHLFLFGFGSQMKTLESLVRKRGLESQVHFLGYRNDKEDLLQAADLFLSSSVQEGLLLSLMEAMASGIPCVASRIRGNTDLITSKCGFLVEPTKCDEFAKAINTLAVDSNLRHSMGVSCIEQIHSFDINTIDKENCNLNKNAISKGFTQYFPQWVIKRFEIGIPLDATLIISVGDLNRNKNNYTVIEAIKEIPNAHYIICGEGLLKEYLMKCSEGIKQRVHFLGWRTDIKELMIASDIFVLPSLREGLSRSLMEAMASGLPCVVSNIRGNQDLIIDGENGFLCNPLDPISFEQSIKNMIENKKLNTSFGRNNREKIRKYSSKVVSDATKEIYCRCVKGNC